MKNPLSISTVTARHPQLTQDALRIFKKTFISDKKVGMWFTNAELKRTVPTPQRSHNRIRYIRFYWQGKGIKTGTLLYISEANNLAYDIAGTAN